MSKVTSKKIFSVLLAFVVVALIVVPASEVAFASNHDAGIETAQQGSGATGGSGVPSGIASRMWSFITGGAGAAVTDLTNAFEIGTKTPAYILPFVIILYFAGWIMDFAVGISVLGEVSGVSIYSAAVISEGWTVFRDLVNIIFIFIVIYIGLTTILGLSSSNTKSLLVRVIVVALLINFSLVITGLVIDAGNVAAIAFYEAFPPRDGLAAWFGADGRSLSYPFVQGSQIGRFSGSGYFNFVSSIPIFGPTLAGLASVKGWILSAGIIIVHIVASFILFAAAILFVIRTVVLWFLMIISPIAFAAAILPSTKPTFNIWMRQFVNQVMWAPAFLALYYVAVRIFTSPGLASVIAGSLLGAILGFIIVVALLVAALNISRKLGAIGAATAVRLGDKYRKRAGGFVGRNTLGRGAQRLEEKYGDRLRKRAPRASRLVLAPLQGTASAGFGGAGGGFRKAEEKRVKRLQKEAEKMSPEDRKVFLSRLQTPFKGSDQSLQKAYDDELSAELNRIEKDTSLSPNQKLKAQMKAKEEVTEQKEKGSLLNRAVGDKKTATKISEKFAKDEMKLEARRKQIDQSKSQLEKVDTEIEKLDVVINDLENKHYPYGSEASSTDISRLTAATSEVNKLKANRQKIENEITKAEADFSREDELAEKIGKLGENIEEIQGREGGARREPSSDSGDEKT